MNYLSSEKLENLNSGVANNWYFDYQAYRNRKEKNLKKDVFFANGDKIVATISYVDNIPCLYAQLNKLEKVTNCPGYTYTTYTCDFWHDAKYVKLGTVQTTNRYNYLKQFTNAFTGEELLRICSDFKSFDGEAHTIDNIKP